MHLDRGRLVLLESLSPVERAVFFLREVFDFGYEEIAAVVGKSEENCRQIAVRARRQAEAKKPRFEASRRRVLRRVSRAAWRRRGDLDPHLAAVIGLSPSRVHQIVAAADLDALDAALGELRAAGWPAPEDPDSREDAELDGRDHIADRLSDEVSWLRQCAGWLAHLDAESSPPAVNLRPAADWPDRAIVAIDLARVAAVIDRIAADVDELARARRVHDLNTAAVLPDPRAERRRRLAEPDLEFRAFCTRRRLPASSSPQLERAWDAWQAERYRRGEIDQHPGYTDNPFRPR